MEEKKEMTRKIFEDMGMIDEYDKKFKDRMFVKNETIEKVYIPTLSGKNAEGHSADIDKKSDFLFTYWFPELKKIDKSLWEKIFKGKTFWILGRTVFCLSYRVNYYVDFSHYFDYNSGICAARINNDSNVFVIGKYTLPIRVMLTLDLEKADITENNEREFEIK